MLEIEYVELANKLSNIYNETSTTDLHCAFYETNQQDILLLHLFHKLT